MHLFSALAILSLSKIIGLYSDPFQANDDASLYTWCRAILEDMATVGNAAARDHESLLKDVEALIHEASTHSDTPMLDVGATNQLWDLQFSWENSGLNELMNDQPWYDLDWRGLLEGYSWGV